MTRLIISAFICIGFCWPGSLSGYTVRAPLVGFSLPEPGQRPPASWFSETRIINRGSAQANVAVTDVIGYGNVPRLAFTIPFGGIADLPYLSFLDAGKSPQDQQFFALVEFTSDEPISVYTAITTYTLVDPACPGALIPLPPPGFFPYWGGGCSPVSGPLVRGFTDYLLPNATYLMPWLVGENQSFRSNLYFTNPAPLPITVVGTFRTADGAVAVSLTFRVEPHSQLIVPRIFEDPRLRPVALGGTALQGAATATFVADGQFYVMAAVSNNIDQGQDSINRFAMVQPEPLQ